MNKGNLLVFLFLGVSLILIPCFVFSAEDSITITTYYPSPWGVYNNLEVRNRLRVKGDADGDGHISVSDARLIGWYTVGTAIKNIYNETPLDWVMDYNNDGIVNIMDAKGIQWSVANNLISNVEFFHSNDDDNPTVYIDNSNTAGVALDVTQGSTLVRGFLNRGGSGDVDGDGNVDPTDALFILHFYVGDTELTEKQLAAGDVNGDGIITDLDALLIMHKAVGNYNLNNANDRLLFRRRFNNIYWGAYRDDAIREFVVNFSPNITVPNFITRVGGIGDPINSALISYSLGNARTTQVPLQPSGLGVTYQWLGRDGHEIMRLADTAAEKGLFFDGGQIADYVFSSNYKLRNIEDQAEYMWKNKSLPAMAKVKKHDKDRNTIEIVSQMNAMLEELEKAHIYISQLNERLGKLESENNALRKSIDDLKRKK